MSDSHPGFRIFVLGAGFSQAAGLPLASKLFSMVRRRIERVHGYDTQFQLDVRNYLEYRKACDNVELVESNIDLEQFMSFLDIEHYLGLRGSDTWSKEGNISQLMIRKAIGQVIQSNTPEVNALPDVYYRFAENLSTTDLVITFNYDILLERALEYVGKPYRLFPDRFKDIGRTSCEIDTEHDEVVVLKLHGSVDWFSDLSFQEIKEINADYGLPGASVHSIFDRPERYAAEPLVQGPRPHADPLLHIYRIREADAFYRENTKSFEAPVILSPSHVKFIYSEPFLGFWRGLGRAGGYNLGVSVIGFSLPAHDEYIRIGLYQMISNYQQSWWDDKVLRQGPLKDDVKFVDLKREPEAVAVFKKRYAFAEPTKTAYYLAGFDNEAVDFLFSKHRTS